MALPKYEDEERGGRSDVTNSACAGEAKGGGLDPMALSAPPADILQLLKQQTNKSEYEYDHQH